MLSWQRFILSINHSWLICHIINSHMLSWLNTNKLHFNTWHHLGINILLRLRLCKINDLHRITEIKGRDRTDSGIMVKTGDILTLTKFQCLTPNCYLTSFMWGRMCQRRYCMLIFPTIPSIIPMLHVHSMLGTLGTQLKIACFSRSRFKNSLIKSYCPSLKSNQM